MKKAVDRLGQRPKHLGAFRVSFTDDVLPRSKTGEEKRTYEVRCENECIIPAPSTPFNAVCLEQRAGVSAYRDHCGIASRSITLEELNELRDMKKWEWKEKVVSITKVVLDDAKDVWSASLSNFQPPLGNNGWKFDFSLCYELQKNAKLPADLVVHYDPHNHASVTFKDGWKGCVSFETSGSGKNMNALGIHRELVESDAWKLHCFVIRAAAEVSEDIYRDPKVLQLMLLVEQYMDVCDEEDFSALMCALNDTQIIDEKEKTLKGIFVDSSHAPFFLRAINNIKKSLSEEEQIEVEDLLRHVDV